MAADNLERESHTAEKIADEPKAGSNDLEKSETESFKQDGVKNVEAVTSVWSKKALWLTFVM